MSSLLVSDPFGMLFSPPGIFTYPSHHPSAYEAVSCQAVVCGSSRFLRAPRVTRSSWFESTGSFTLSVTRVVRKRNCCQLTPSQALHLQTAGASSLDSSFATQLNWDLTVKPLLRQERLDFNLSQIGFSYLFFPWWSSNTLAFIFSLWIVASTAGNIIQMRILPAFSLLYIKTFHLSSVPHQVFSSQLLPWHLWFVASLLCAPILPLFPLWHCRSHMDATWSTKLQQSWWAS